MSKQTLLPIWSMLFALCAILGFIPEPAGFLKALLVLLSLGFFVPPALLVWRGDPDSVRLVRGLSAASLGATLVMILVNFFSVGLSEAAGNLVYCILIIVSTPMICSGYWVLSLFCWAFLLIWSWKKLRAK